MSEHDHEHDGGEIEVVADPIADPGLPPHLPRPTDVSEAAEKRAERQVATLFGLSALFSVLFGVCFFLFDIGDRHHLIFGLGASTVTLGLTLGLALLLIGVGAIHWSRTLMNDHEIVEYRHPIVSSDEDRDYSVAALQQGLDDSGIARRPLIRNSLLASVAFLGIPAVVALRDLGPLPGNKLAKTVWTEDMQLVRDVSGTPIRAADLVVGDLINGEPAAFFEVDEHGEHVIEGTELLQEKAKAAIIIVRIHPDDLKVAKGRENWHVNGVLAFSKICTHVGCPISLYEQQTHHLLCPCHQSTFDLADNGKVVFGPAARALPQLPIREKDGFLVAQSDFTEPVGPSYWERG